MTDHISKRVAAIAVLIDGQRRLVDGLAKRLERERAILGLLHAERERQSERYAAELAKARDASWGVS